MKRVKLLSFLMLLGSGGVYAQSTTGVTVGLSQAGPVFYVDGQTYNTSHVFLWPVGSTHVVQFPYSVDLNGNTLQFQAGGAGTVEWTFGGWADNAGLLSPAGSPVQTVTVFSGMTSLIGSVTELMQLAITFPANTGSGGSNVNCSGAPGNPAPPEGGAGPFGYGLVYVNGTCFSDSTVLFIPAGPVTLNAFPFPGYGFVGFEYGGNPPNPYLYNYNLTVPGSAVYAVFSPAKRVSFRTNPLALEVTVDSVVLNTPPALPTSIPEPNNVSNNCTPNYDAIPPNTVVGITPLCIGDFDFLPGSTHKIGAPPAQQDSNGAWWVFNAFTDSQGKSLTNSYTTDSATNQPDLVTAGFIAGTQAAILTSPSGSKSQWTEPPSGLTIISCGGRAVPTPSARPPRKWMRPAAPGSSRIGPTEARLRRPSPFHPVPPAGKASRLRPTTLCWARRRLPACPRV